MVISVVEMRRGNSGRLSSLPGVAQLVRGGVKFPMQMSLTLNSVFLRAISVIAWDNK